MNHRRPLARALLTAIGVAASAATPALAQSLYHTEINAQANAFGLAAPVQPPAVGGSISAPAPFAPQYATQQADIAGPTLPGSVQGRAAAGAWTETGALHLSTQAQASVISSTFSSPNPNGSGTSSAAALFREVVVFDVPQAVPGTLFDVSVTLHLHVLYAVDGLLTGTAAPSFVAPNASWQAAVRLFSGAGSHFQYARQGACSWVVATGQPNCSGDPTGSVTLHFQIPTGTNLVLEMSASARSFAGALLQGPGSASSGSLVDMGNTLAWGGVPQVWDATGAPVAGYSMVGLGSGFDFRHPAVSAVPEPSAALLLMAGLAGLAWRRGLQSRPRNSRSRSISAPSAAR